jgi:hypothetical protein
MRCKRLNSIVFILGHGSGTVLGAATKIEPRRQLQLFLFFSFSVSRIDNVEHHFFQLL